MSSRDELAMNQDLIRRLIRKHDWEDEDAYNPNCPYYRAVITTSKHHDPETSARELSDLLKKLKVDCVYTEGPYDIDEGHGLEKTIYVFCHKQSFLEKVPFCLDKIFVIDLQNKTR